MPSSPSPPEIPEGLEHMLSLFIAEMARDAARLAELAGMGGAGTPLDDLAEHAHAMRGKAGLFGEHCLYELLTQMEHCALAGNLASVPALLARVVERTGQLEVYGREIAAAQA